MLLRNAIALDVKSSSYSLRQYKDLLITSSVGRIVKTPCLVEIVSAELRNLLLISHQKNRSHPVSPNFRNFVINQRNFTKVFFRSCLEFLFFIWRL